MDTKLLPSGIDYKRSVTYFVGTAALIIGINILIKLVKTVFNYRYQLSFLKAFPGPKSKSLFGSFFQRSPIGKIFLNRLSLAKKYGPVYQLHVSFCSTQLVASSPEYIKRILSNADPKETIGYKFLKAWLGDGLLVSKGKKWSRNRRLLTPAFHFDILKPYQKIFSASAQVMVKKWKRHYESHPNDSIEMFESVSLMTLDSLMKCIFGIEGNFQEEMKQHPYIQAVYQLTTLIDKRFSNFLHYSNFIYYFSNDGRKFQRAARVTQGFSRSLIQTRRQINPTSATATAAANGSSTKRHVDFLDMLLQCKDETGQGMSDQEIQDEVETFLFEGHDTTASGISWTLYNLALHPRHQERCREEINLIIGDNDSIEWDDLGKLSHINMCIKESLRLYTTVTAVGRRLSKPVTFPCGRSIPGGTWVVADIHSCHHDADIWPDPEIFDPERFLPDNAKTHHSHAFLPFSAGPRNCIGQHFAMNEMKTVIALILKNFHLEADSSKPTDPCQSVILRAEDGIWLKLTPIQG